MASLAATVPLFVRQLDHGPDPGRLQRLLSTRALPPPCRTVPMTAEESTAVSWLSRASRPLAHLADDLIASELLPRWARRRPGGQSPRRRGTSGGRCCTGRWSSRSSGWIEINPLTGRRLVARHRGPTAVDPRVVVNPMQARQLLAAVTYGGGRRRRDRERERVRCTPSSHACTTRLWEQAREIGLSPEQAASPLARRPYDLRHAALSSWLAAGSRPPRSPSAPGTPSRCC